MAAPAVKATLPSASVSAKVPAPDASASAKAPAAAPAPAPTPDASASAKAPDAAPAPDAKASAGVKIHATVPPVGAAVKAAGDAVKNAAVKTGAAIKAGADKAGAAVKGAAIKIGVKAGNLLKGITAKLKAEGKEGPQPQSWNVGTPARAQFVTAWNTAALLSKKSHAIFDMGKECFEGIVKLKAKLACAACDSTVGSKLAAGLHIKIDDVTEITKDCNSFFFMTKEIKHSIVAQLNYVQFVVKKPELEAAIKKITDKSDIDHTGCASSSAEKSPIPAGPAPAAGATIAPDATAPGAPAPADAAVTPAPVPAPTDAAAKPAAAPADASKTPADPAKKADASSRLLNK